MQAPKNMSMTPSSNIERLVEIMAALRHPETGCPWDVGQTFQTIAPYTLEEAYEVVDAIDTGTLEDLRDELGDLLLQVVFHARMAEEAGAFAFGDVVKAITAKLIRRHPHVFGDGRAQSAVDVKHVWAAIKAEEKSERRRRRAAAGLPGEEQGILSGVPAALPAMAAALKLQAKASSVGFDWNDPNLVIDKIREETDEVVRALAGHAPDEAAAEIGDLLFAVVNLARHLDVDPDAALRRTNLKFRRRFSHIEAELAKAGKTPEQADLDEMETLWVSAKKAEE